MTDLSERLRYTLDCPSSCNTLRSEAAAALDAKDAEIARLVKEKSQMAWVLIFGLGYTWSFTVSGIQSEYECQQLGRKLQAEWILPAPSFKCFSYMAR